MRILPTFVLFFLLFAGGCATRQVTRSELDAAMTRHVGSTINHMFYMGTRNGEHYLRHQYTDGVRTYRISENELGIDRPFPYTRDPERWKLVAERWWPSRMDTLRLTALDEPTLPDRHSGAAEGVIKERESED